MRPIGGVAATDRSVGCPASWRDSELVGVRMNVHSLRARLLVAFLAVVATALGSVGLSVVLVGPGYFDDAVAHLTGDSMGAAMDAAIRVAFTHAMGRALLAATVTAVVVAAVVSLAIAARLGHPLARLAGAASRIAAGHYAERVPDDELDDLRNLAGSFNEMAKSLEATERRRLQLVGDIAHELRTPLTTLDGYLEGLEDDVVEAGPKTWHLLRTETRRLTRLVDDLAELWRAEAHQLILHPVQVDTTDLARSVEARFAAQAQARDVALEVRGSSVTATADPDRLAQILSNYLSNAIRHAPSRTRITVASEAVGDRVRLSVTDQGPGLATRELEAVFERFYRVDAARSRAAGGSGIGLAIVRALARAMGGRAWAESPGMGQGATFFVEVPAA